jgi:hypothetical protein
MKKSWQEKMADKPNLPKILVLERGFPCYNAVHNMGAEEGDPVILVNPSEILPYMQAVLPGKLTTIMEICKAITVRHNVKGCCTLTSGIFIMTIANAVEEMKKEGVDISVPYWRTLKADGSLNPKYPGGIEAHKSLLESEDFPIMKKGKLYFVKDFEQFLV